MSFDMLAQQKAIHENALNHGFWDRNGVAQDPFDPGVVAEKLALIHSEVSEALEAVRHGNPPSDHVPEMDGFSEELADTVIRILDLAEARGIDLRNAILTKHSFNLSRSAMHGGKLI